MQLRHVVSCFGVLGLLGLLTYYVLVADISLARPGVRVAHWWRFPWRADVQSGPWAKVYSINRHVVVAVLLLRLDQKAIAAVDQSEGHLGLRALCSVVGSENQSSTAGKGYWVNGNFGSYKYEAAVVWCKFSRPPGKKARFAIDGVEVGPVVELPRRRYYLTVCSQSSLFGTIRANWLATFMEFYSARWEAEHFFLYSTVPLDMGNLSAKLADAYTTIDTSSQNAFDTHYHAQDIVMHDCLYRNVAMGTKWTFFVDVDEFAGLVTSIAPWKTLLHASENEFSTITFGSWKYDLSVCSKVAGKSVSVPYRFPEAECRPDPRYFPKEYRVPPLCIDYQGRRKYIVQPANVTMVKIHSSDFPRRLRHLSTDEGFLHHYQGAQIIGVEICKRASTCNSLSRKMTCTDNHKHAVLAKPSNSPLVFDVQLGRMTVLSHSQPGPP